MTTPNTELREAILKILQTGAMTYDNGNKQVLFSADTHADEIIALFQAREQQMISELKQEATTVMRPDKTFYKAVPVSVIERLQNKTNDGGRDGDSNITAH